MMWLKNLLGRQTANELIAETDCIYAIGDVHGRLDLLTNLLKKVIADARAFQDKRVVVVFLGDYIDRGLQSSGVLDFLSKLEMGRIETIFLRGNHDQVLLDFLQDPEVGADWFQFGGRETLLSYKVQPPIGLADASERSRCQKELLQKIPAPHIDFLKRTKLSHECGRCFFVHAGVDPDKPMAAQTSAELLWIREAFLESTKPLSHVIVHGHTPESGPVWNGRRIGIDTGAYISNSLTAARISGSSVSFLST